MGKRGHADRGKTKVPVHMDAKTDVAVAGASPGGRSVAPTGRRRVSARSASTKARTRPSLTTRSAA